MRRKTGSMLCPSCGKLISVSAPVCPFCGTRQPGLWGFGPALSKIFGGRIDPVSVIPIACVAFYMLSLGLDLRAAFGMGGGLFRILSPSSAALRALGSTSSFDFADGRYWTLLTAIYLHGGLLHILFNLLWIRDLGPAVQSAYGPARFFLIWSIAGAVGFFFSDLLPGHSSIGASGSIFGLLAALIVYGRTAGAWSMARQAWQWAIVLGIMGFLLPGVDNLAHIGGFAGGWLASTAMRRGIGRREGRGVTLAALAFLLLTVLGFAINFGEVVGFMIAVARP
jgi:rhomboid protease GluP